MRRRSTCSWFLAFGAACAGAIGGGAIGSPTDDALPAPESLRVPKGVAFPAIVVLRDPFRVESSASPIPTIGGETQSDFVLPPNAAVAGPRLRAVIVGGAPRALIEENGRTHVVGVGSALAGSVVTAISENEVRLDDGEALRLTGPQP